MTSDMRPRFWIDKLVDALWNGRISERDFISDAQAMGLSLEEVLDELFYLKEEDGIYE